ncbi:ABC transporter C family member 10-like isoform X1 [Carex rostrata]
MVPLASSITGFCGTTICAYGNSSGCILAEILDSSTCINHIVVLSISSMISVLLLINLILRISKANVPIRRLFGLSSPIHLLSAIFNGVLAFFYLGLGVYMLLENFSKRYRTYYEPHWWLAMLSLGLYQLLLSLLFTCRFRYLKMWSILPTIFSGFICGSSIAYLLKEKKLTADAILDVLSLPGAFLWVVCAVYNSRDEEETINGNLYKPLNSDIISVPLDQKSNVTLLSTAGFFSIMSFWWLNPLMKKGYEKPLEEKDIPDLGEIDRAGTQYTIFLDKLNHKKQTSNQKSLSPSIFWTIVSCHKREIFVSGFFALLKVLTLSAGPMILNAFIKVSMGQEAFKYEGYVLAVGLFFAKCTESLSQRQWYFRTRRQGLQVRSLLSAAIYKKQQRLSNLAKLTHSSGEIMNYVTVDAYRIGEFPYWFHQTWTTSLQLCIALVILYKAVGLATISSMVVIILMVACNAPLANLQHKFQTRLMEAQDKRLKAMSESLVNVKVIKLYAWDGHFRKVIEELRQKEYVWIRAFQLRKAYNIFLSWSSPVVVSAATFLACYLLGIPLEPSNVFTFVATLRLVQIPVRQIPEVIGVVIQAKVAFARIEKFLEAPELQTEKMRMDAFESMEKPVVMESCDFSWDENLSRPTLRNVSLVVKAGEKVAICGEVGSGKSTLLAAFLGEVPKTRGMIQVCGKIAYVSQNAWIQTGTVQENILFGSPMNKQRYQETLERCSLVKDLEMLPFGDQTQIGERGINLSGGQKQRVQLARALYQNADIYLLDDPFSAVDAQTASSLFNEYVMGALANKTVLLVTHQVDFLPTFDRVMLMSDGEILRSAAFCELFASCMEFQDLVHAHKETAGIEKLNNMVPQNNKNETINGHEISKIDGGTIKNVLQKENAKLSEGGSDQLIKKEERERGNTGLKPFMQYLGQNKGYLYYSLLVLAHIVFVTGQISQNTWMAGNVQNPNVSTLKLILVYLGIGFGTVFILFFRSLLLVVLGLEASKSLFSQLLGSLFRAPMGFYDSTPLGRILSRVSSDLTIVDLDVPVAFVSATSATLNAYSNLGVLAGVTWQVLFVSVFMIVLAIRIQRYHRASAKELMRINGTTKSLMVNLLSESIAGAITIRAFEEEDRFFAKYLELIDKNASPYLYNFSSSEWLIQRLETMSAAIVASSALVMTLLPPGTFGAGFVGMALSYGLSLNNSFVNSIQNQCKLENLIISVERINQYMNIESEAPEVIEDSRPPPNWPAIGTVKIQGLKIRYRPDTPLVLCGITCTFQGGHKIGIVGRTGSGKTTLIGALFRLVEPAGGKIVIDGLDITKIGLHDLRSRFGVIPQDPTLFHGSVRYNMDPLGQFTDQQIWEVLDKCQLREAVQEKEHGLDSLVVEDGSNWSMGQRQLFCLGRALLRRSRILVLDEATASIDNATDAILQKTIRTEFVDCTVITVAHRIPTVMDCNMVLAISDGKLVEYDDPMKLMNTEGSMFRELVKEYWSLSANGNI